VKLKLRESKILQEKKHMMTEDGFIDVVSAVVKNDQGKHCMVHHQVSNRWEFPGGKVDLGESLEDALGREMYEELGINVTDSTLL